MIDSIDVIEEKEKKRGIGPLFSPLTFIKKLKGEQERSKNSTPIQKEKKKKS